MMDSDSGSASDESFQAMEKDPDKVPCYFVQTGECDSDVNALVGNSILI